MNTVFLIGMPGAGKSHWGRIWSREHGFRLFDLDEIIEAEAAQSIPEIIRGRGEAGFRELETLVLDRVVSECRSMDAIISCGGGTPTIGQNLRLMQDSGCVVYLEAPAATLLRQLRMSAVPRPLLTEFSLSGLEDLLKKRENFYRQAHIVIPLSTATAGTFAEILQACINRHS